MAGTVLTMDKTSNAERFGMRLISIRTVNARKAEHLR